MSTIFSSGLIILGSILGVIGLPGCIWMWFRAQSFGLTADELDILNNKDVLTSSIEHKMDALKPVVYRFLFCLFLLIVGVVLFVWGWSLHRSKEASWTTQSETNSISFSSAVSVCWHGSSFQESFEKHRGCSRIYQTLQTRASVDIVNKRG